MKRKRDTLSSSEDERMIKVSDKQKEGEGRKIQRRGEQGESRGSYRNRTSLGKTVSSRKSGEMGRVKK